MTSKTPVAIVKTGNYATLDQAAFAALNVASGSPWKPGQPVFEAFSEISGEESSANNC